jgi:uncharacterized protein
MEIENLLQSIDKAADEQWKNLALERMNLTELPPEIDRLNQFETFIMWNWDEIAKIEEKQFPGSEGEHLLQEKYQTRDRAIRFYNKQVFGKLNKTMRKFICQTEMSFVSTWGKWGQGCNIYLSLTNSYILNDNILVIQTDNDRSLKNIESNPHLTVCYVNFIDKQIGLHVNGKTKTVTGAEILISKDYPGQNLYGLPSASIPIELIGKARENPNGCWSILTIEECYIHCSKHILAHRELQEKLTGVETSVSATLESVRESILKTEMFVIATADRHGETDCSFRGGPTGFIQIHEGKIRSPEYRGNGVLASLGNITENNEVAILIFDFCSIDRKTILIEGKAKIIDTGVDYLANSEAEKAIEYWIEIEPTSIQVRQEGSRPVYHRIENQKVPWGTDDDLTKKSAYFIGST